MTVDRKVMLTEENFELLLDIVGDTGENEDLNDVINRIAKFYLHDKEGRTK